MKNRLKQRKRQQRSIWKMETSFKVGDAIVIPSRGNGIFYFNALFSESDIAEARHATPAEIAAGRRIEIFGNSEELEVLDLADVGPNTKVSEL